MNKLATACLLLAGLLSLVPACAPVSKGPAEPDAADHLLALQAPAPKWEGANDHYCPPDDAPLDELLDFWGGTPGDAPTDQRLPPSAIVQHRLLAPGAASPEELAAIIYYLPPTPKAYHSIQLAADGLPESPSRQTIRDWLMTHGDYDRQNLIAIANGKPPLAPTQIDRAGALTALAKLDWQTADALLRRLSKDTDRNLVSLCLTTEYQHALETHDEPAEAEFRKQLQTFVAESNGNGFDRRDICRLLLTTDWPGREEWITSMLSDYHWAGEIYDKWQNAWRCLEGRDAFAGPLTADPDRYIPILAKLAGNPDPNIRNAGFLRLVQYPRADALEPILNLLNQPPSGNDDESREMLLTALASVKVPASIPQLLKAAEKSEGHDLVKIALAMAYQDPAHAAPVLNKALASIELNDHDRYAASVSDIGQLVNAAIDCHALSNEQIVNDVEQYCAIPSTSSSGLFSGSEIQRPREACIGEAISEISPSRPGIAAKLLDRWNAIRQKSPELAGNIWRIVITWPDEAIDFRLANLISDEPLNNDFADAAIARAATMRKNCSTIMRDWIRTGGQPGLAAGLLNDSAAANAILNGSDMQAQRMLLAVARLLRTPLPISTVAKLMASNDPRLSHAAERYLSCEDGPEARRLVLARHPGEELVLGAGWGGFAADPDPTDNPENKVLPLQKEMQAKDGPDDIFAMFHSGMGYYSGCEIIRFRGDSAAFELQSAYTPGKILTRELSVDERQRFLAFLAREHFDDLPQLETNMVDGPMSEYVHLNHAGGRSIFMHGQGWYGTAGSPHYRLIRLIERMAETGTWHTSYPALEKSVPGMRIVYTDRAKPLNGVWIRGNDLLVSQGEKDKLAWHVLSQGKLGDVIAPPIGFAPTEYDEYDMPTEVFVNTPQMNARWKVLAGDSVIIWKDNIENQGYLYRWHKPDAPVQLGDLKLFSPVTTYDGNWMLATHDDAIVSMNLQTGKVHNYTLSAGRSYGAELFIPTIKRMLVSGDKQVGDKTQTQYWLVDPATDKAETISGDFGPLLHTVGRLINSTTNAEDVWLTLTDEHAEKTRLIRYSTRTWKSTEVLSIPGVRIPNDRIAIDEKNHVVYLVVYGDLLSVPLP